MSSEQRVRPGEVFEGPTKTLTDAHFLFFSALTGDVHPLHYDVEYARSTPVGKPTAHALLLNSLTALGAMKGRDRIGRLLFTEQGSRLLAPVVVGDTMRPVMTLERAWDENGASWYRFRTELFNQRGEKVMEGFHVYRVLGA